MLYAISGSQGTGKSTLLASLPASIKQVTRKTSRSVLSDWGVTLSQVNNDRPLTIKFQDEILKRKIDDEHEAVQSTDVFFTERTFADLFVYALIALGKDNEYSDWLDDYYHRCRQAQAKYSGVFYLHGGHFPPVNDGVRAINQHYSRLVDGAMLDYTFRMSGTARSSLASPPIIPVHTGDSEERLNLVLSTLQKQTT